LASIQTPLGIATNECRCEDAALWARYFQTTKLHEVGFRALLMENGAERLELARI
jgi:hypothetical protein